MKTDYYAWAARRCAQKEYSRAEMLAKLMEKGAAAAEARDCVDRLAAERYLDDARFAKAFVSDKVRFDHWGRVKIRYALHLKGVADDLYCEIDITMGEGAMAMQIHVVVGQPVVASIRDIVASKPAAHEGAYNLQGIRVASKLHKGLPQGVYIVNGQKRIWK